MAKTKQRVHREHIRPVALGGRKSCPSCKAKITQFWSWGEYHNGKWRTVQHFCQTCYKADVERKLVSHAMQCGCTFELVGHDLPNRELPGWIQLPPMNLEGMPTLPQCVALVGEPGGWKGRCAEIATTIAAEFLDESGFPRYGGWLGGVHPDSFFADRRGLPFVRHGWFELKDGRVFDPTRWVFEAAQPYLYVGPAAMYDVGMMTVTRGHAAPPAFDPTRSVQVPAAAANPHFRAVADTYFPDNPADRIGIAQVFFLANLPPRMMPGPDRIRGVYAAIVALGYKAAIPFDMQQLFLQPVTAKQALAGVQ